MQTNGVKCLKSYVIRLETILITELYFDNDFVNLTNFDNESIFFLDNSTCFSQDVFHILIQEFSRYYD